MACDGEDKPVLHVAARQGFAEGLVLMLQAGTQVRALHPSNPL